jgi:hypothetical protein
LRQRLLLWMCRQGGSLLGPFLLQRQPPLLLLLSNRHDVLLLLLLQLLLLGFMLLRHFCRLAAWWLLSRLATL